MPTCWIIARPNGAGKTTFALEYDIIRCFPRSLHNLFQLFAPLVDQTHCFINSGAQSELVFRQIQTQQIVFKIELFEQLQKAALS